MDSLKLGTLTIPLSPGQGGAVMNSADPALGPLQAILNAALTGATMKELRQLLEHAENAKSTPAVAIARPYPEDDLPSFEAQWQALTGEPAGNDVYILETRWDHKRLLVPRLTLLSLLDRMEAIRGGAAVEPPEEDLAYIEAKGAEADAYLAAGNYAEAGAGVKFFLALLEGHGFLDPKYHDVNWNRAKAGPYPVLQGYLRAIDELSAYYRSEQRQQYIQPPDFPPIVGGPVSLEWFRQGVSTPGGMDPLTWLAFCEWVLRSSTIELTGNELFSRVGGVTYHLRFRREDGVHPALTWAARRERSERRSENP